MWKDRITYDLVKKKKKIQILQLILIVSKFILLYLYKRTRLKSLKTKRGEERKYNIRKYKQQTT